MKQIISSCIAFSVLVMALASAPIRANAQGGVISPGCIRWGQTPQHLAGMSFFDYFLDKPLYYQGETIKITSTALFKGGIGLPKGSAPLFSTPLKTFSYTIPVTGGYVFYVETDIPGGAAGDQADYDVYCEPQSTNVRSGPTVNR